jgi:hypothetical protein
MPTRTAGPSSLPFGAGRSTPSVRRSSLLFILLLVVLPGCTYYTRPARTQPDLYALRARTYDADLAAGRFMLTRLCQRTKSRYDQYRAGRLRVPPTLNVLILSGGGDWGAFGAGFLRGWGRVPASSPFARPDFDGVTGVSTGALIAPFAFVGTDDALAAVEHLYRNPKPDWVVKRKPFFFLPNHISFASVPGLEREVRTHVSADLVARIAARGAGGRLLAVNTTNLDDASPRVFDLVAEADRAAGTHDYSRIHKILLASAGIPGAFPFRIIDHQMYVDGGVTGNIIYGGRLAEEDSLPAIWQQLYPDVPVPPIRYWVIFNNQLHPPPQVVEPNWPAVVTRSLEISTRSATLTALRHLHALAEISRLKRHADVRVYTASIPNDWAPPVAGTFQKETMNALADLGRRMGSDPSSWSASPPPP